MSNVFYVRLLSMDHYIILGVIYSFRAIYLVFGSQEIAAPSTMHIEINVTVKSLRGPKDIIFARASCAFLGKGKEFVK